MKRLDILPLGMVERLLERFDMPAYPDESPAGLEALYRAWCRNVPFDNIRKLIAVRNGDTSPLPGDVPADFLNAFLEHGVGGTCWAGNGALATLLVALGFDAVRAVGTMMVAPGIPPNHGSVAVRFGAETFITDASIMHFKPLRVNAAEVTRIDHPAYGVIGHWVDGAFMIRWRPWNRPEGLDCRIDSWSVDETRFRGQHEGTRTWSPFNYELTFNLVRNGGRIGVSGGQRVALDAAGVETASPLGDERMAYLVDVLGVSEALAARLPEDQPTPPPPGSRTAARGQIRDSLPISHS